MKVQYLKSFEKDLKKINDKKTKQKLKSIIIDIKSADTLDEIPDIRKLSGHPNAFRMHIGVFRLGFYYQKETLVFARFVKRNDIYKLFP